MDLRQLFELHGKVALVTGASRGIGFMIAEGLLSAGVRTFICARRETELEAARAKLAAFGDCEAIVADLGTEAGIANVRKAMTGETKLHILVNNAGATWAAPLEEFPRAGFEKLLNLNVVAPFELTKALLPLLTAAASTDDPARIINISSTSGIAPPARESYPYSASKAGLIMLTRHLAEQLAARCITVNAVAPGVFPSRMTEFMFDPKHSKHVPLPKILLGRTGRTEDIAGAIIYLASRAGSFLTGVTIPVAGGGEAE